MLPNTLIEIGKTVSNRRDTLKITQEKLAAISGVSLRTIREVEQGSGNPSMETLDKLFEALGLEIMVQIKNKGL
ncbi:MAG TPA: helix-turn-helix domain-containing protein [Sediminibacterium sp.]|nr:helix-turn-helix domain-containing protein [Sediminibacterium sp.]